MQTEPFYFGPEERLFGILDTPTSSPIGGVVIAQPIGHESLNCHRACRRLALGLVERGFAVLRFDYRGCGDSLGGAEIASWNGWVDDTRSAIGLLRRRGPVSGIGLRIGASLLAAVSVGDDRLDRLVLWDPVSSGREYLDRVRAEHAELARSYPSRSSESGDEILGFRLPTALTSSIDKLELRPESVATDRGVFVLTGAGGERAGSRGDEPNGAMPIEHRVVEQPESWITKPAIVPAASLATIVDWLTEPGS